MKNKIVITAALMSILTLLSKLIGFTRELVMAGFYGTSYITDAFVLANSIPTMIFGGFFAAVATAYMPLLSDRHEIGEKQGKRFTDEMISISLGFAIISAMIGIVFAGGIVKIFGYSGETAVLTTGFLRISFLLVIASSTLNIRNYWLQHEDVFLPQIVGGYAMSGSVIVCIVLSTRFGLYWLPLGYVIGYVVQLMVSVVVTRRHGYRYRPRIRVVGTVKEIAGISFMVFIGSMVTQINQFVDKYFATGLPEGSVSALNYGSLVVTTIIGLTATVISTIVYPRMTQAAARGDYERLGMMLSKGIMLTLIIAVPFTFGIVGFHSEAIQIVFERGAFDSASTRMTESAFLYYGLGMAFTGVNTLIVNGYYAMHNMRTSVWCGMLGVVVNVVLDVVLVRVMAHAGLAMASSVAIGVNTLTMSWFFRRRYPEIRLVESWRKVWMVVGCSAVAVGLGWVVHKGLMAVVWMPRMCYLGIAVVVAVGGYLWLLNRLKFEEVEMLRGVFRRS